MLLLLLFCWCVVVFDLVILLKEQICLRTNSITCGTLLTELIIRNLVRSSYYLFHKTHNRSSQTPRPSQHNETKLLCRTANRYDSLWWRMRETGRGNLFPEDRNPNIPCQTSHTATPWSCAQTNNSHHNASSRLIQSKLKTTQSTIKIINPMIPHYTAPKEIIWQLLWLMMLINDR